MENSSSTSLEINVENDATPTTPIRINRKN